MAVKAEYFDNYTKIDDDNRMLYHFCHEGDCAHCQAGIPFGFPSEDGFDVLSERTLAALAGRAHRILAAIERARAGRQGD